MGNKNLYKARNTANDEFYTLYEDIEKEIPNYKEHLKGKVIYCNADDPDYSNFWKYFVDNYDNLQLGGLLSTYYDEEGDALLTGYDGVDVYQGLIGGNGDFRSEESMKVLEIADVVISNPPFSLYREYLGQLIEHDKDFIIVGNFNSITYKEVFPLIRDNELWVGNNPRGMDFILPNGDLKNVNASWFTNIPLPKRYKMLELSKSYDPEDYPKYDNYDAINVDRVSQIPEDYDGFMGVPITFIDKHNPEQFDIVRFRKGYDGKDLSIDGEYPYFRIIIKRKV